MKNVKLGLIILTAVILAACGKKGGGGGGGAAPAPGPAVGLAGACPLDPYSFNQCAPNTTQLGGSVPGFTWRGQVNIVDPARYRQFLLDHNLCGNQYQTQQFPQQFPNQYPNQYAQCNPGPSMQLEVRTGRGGNYVQLPRPITFALAPQLYNTFPVPSLIRNVMGQANIGNTGFQLVYNRFATGTQYQQQYIPGQQYPQQYPGQPYPGQPAVPNMALQIVFNYIGGAIAPTPYPYPNQGYPQQQYPQPYPNQGGQNTLTATVLYQGIVIATGQVMTNEYPIYNGANINGIQPQQQQVNPNANPANAPALLPINRPQGQ